MKRVVIDMPVVRDTVVARIGGRGLTARAAAELTADARALAVPDPIVREAVLRAAIGDVVFPGALRWREAVLRARPADPAWVPAVWRNARIVELVFAMDALADPHSPVRLAPDDAGGGMSCVGIASADWWRGDVAFEVLALDAGGELARATYSLDDAARRRMWRHLAGTLSRMRLVRGLVEAAPGADEEAGPIGRGNVVVGVRGPGADAVVAREDGDATRARVREDGDTRAEVWRRTEVAEAHAAILLRRHAGGPVVVERVPDVSDFDAADPAGDLGHLASAARGATAVATAVLGTGGLVAASAWVRRHPPALPKFLADLLEGA